METLRADGESEKFLAEGHQHMRHIPILVHQVFLGQGIIGGIDTELESEIDTGGGFTGTGYPDQDNIRLGILFCRRAVIIVQGIIDGIHAKIIDRIISHAVKAADGMR